MTALTLDLDFERDRVDLSNEARFVDERGAWRGTEGTRST